MDALAALQGNLAVPSPDHPARFRRGLFAFGPNSFDFDNGRPVSARAEVYEAQAARLEAFASRVGISVVRASTNLRSLYPDFAAWAAAVNNTPLTAIGHAMRTHLSGLAIASTGLGNDTGIQQQPFVDPLLATHDFDVHPVQQMVTRAEKVRRLAAWPHSLVRRSPPMTSRWIKSIRCHSSRATSWGITRKSWTRSQHWVAMTSSPPFDGASDAPRPHRRGGRHDGATVGNGGRSHWLRRDGSAQPA